MVSARSILGGLTACFVLAALAATPALAQTDAPQSSPSPLAGEAQGEGVENSVVEFDIPAQPLSSALIQLSQQAGVQVVMEGERANGANVGALRGEYAVKDALELLLLGTGFTAAQTGPLTYTVKGPGGAALAGQNTVGQRRPGIEEIIVTGQKKEERIQDVPIAISAFTQEDLTTHQIAGGPDLITQVPNMTFTKTNFTGYSIQIRGIGTQAISATTDPAVAVAFNNTPFIRNRFFEQEFYDLERVEVLRGPQGTLYGRNATAGVVNLISAKPSFEEEAMFSVDYGGNYNSRRLEGMVNIPLVDDHIALRIAGAGTKRDGYATNEITGSPIDGRDLWSTRVSLRVKPNDWMNANLIWEHFEEDDDRLRSGKQLCHQDDRVKTQEGFLFPGTEAYGDVLSQGCIPNSLYAEDSFEAPDGNALPYYRPLGFFGVPVALDNPYGSTVQSSDLRVIESTVDPEYRAKSDIVELQLSFNLTDGLTLESETGYLQDSIFSLQDFNRFNTQSGAFGTYEDEEVNRNINPPDTFIEGDNGNAVFCDPQLGCADRVVAVDVSSAESEQWSQEFRLASQFDGPVNFSLGANYLNYETEDKYYVFINTLTIASVRGFNGSNITVPYDPRTFDNHQSIKGRPRPDPEVPQALSSGAGVPIDTNPIGDLDDDGHNYFLSRNPYELNSYSAFGELYWNITDTLKLTGGLRYTVDKKEAPIRPSWVLAPGTVGYPVAEVINQEWREPTGRLTLDWKPTLSFTDETLVYASYSRGYKAGGANPPVSGKLFWGDVTGGFDAGGELIERSATRPKTFDAEFVNAFEVGTKNTLFDGTVTLNMNAFYYDYKDYQISQIIDRSARNFNFDTEVWGAEIEADWWALENWRLSFKGGHQKTRVGDGEKAVDIMDRTAGRDGWVVARPFPAYSENCILPVEVFFGMEEGDQLRAPQTTWRNGRPGPCELAYQLGEDPRTGNPYEPLEDVFDGYVGFDPSTAPNGGEGFFKDLSGNELPNSPHYTMTLSTDYIVPLKGDWLMTLHGDLYHQTKAWTRIFNTPGYDRLKPYTTVNFAAIFANEESGWNVMAYIKNVFDRDAITGAFLNSDDTGLTTNVFLTEPRLFGLRVTKTWGDRTGERPLMNGVAGLFGREPDAPSPFSWEVGGMLFREDAPYETVAPESVTLYQDELTPAKLQNRDLDLDGAGQLKLAYSPHDKSWFVSGSVRFGKTQGYHHIDREAVGDNGCFFTEKYHDLTGICDPGATFNGYDTRIDAKNWIDGEVSDREEHLLVDFEVGAEVGLGWGIESRVSAGLRYAEFDSSTHLELQGIPNWELPDYDVLSIPATHDYFDTDMTMEREFQGAGPMLSWDANKRLLGDDKSGSLHADWSLSGGVLFGKQETSSKGQESSTFYEQGYYLRAVDIPDGPPVISHGPEDRSTSASVPVPMLGGSLGLSYRIDGASIGAGYRWERHYGVLDGGWDEQHGVDRTIDGLYLKVTFGE